MADFNKVILIGRLTADPESRTFANGGKVTKLRFAMSHKKKNQQTGAWDSEPMYLDIDVFNRGEFGKLADLCQERLRKASQICVEGKLHLETWTEANTQVKRSKHKLVADSVTFLDGKPADGGWQPGPPESPPAGEPDSGKPAGGGAGYGDSIPF